MASCINIQSKIELILLQSIHVTLMPVFCEKYCMGLENYVDVLDFTG